MFNSLPTRSMLALAVGTAMLAACEDSVTSGDPPFYLPADYVFVTTTDFSTGAAAIVSADTLLEAQCNVSAIHSDAVARFYDGRMYVMNRQGGDNIQVLDPYAGFATIKQFSVGNGSDPHDIAFVSRSRAFVTRYNEDQLWIVDTNTGRRSGLIDFSWLRDLDDIPEMDHMVRIGDRVFVSVQRLNRTTDWGPVGTSYLAAFDPFTEQFIDAEPLTGGTQALALDGANPFGEMVFNKQSGLIWIPAAGRFGVNDGGLELVNPATFTTSGLVITEATLGGDITDVVPIDANRGVAIVTGANFSTLVGFDLSAPASVDTIYAPGAWGLYDAELARDGRIFVADQTNLVQPGLRVFRADTWAQLTTSPIDVCLPPTDIEFGRR